MTQPRTVEGEIRLSGRGQQWGYDAFQSLPGPDGLLVLPAVIDQTTVAANSEVDRNAPDAPIARCAGSIYQADGKRQLLRHGSHLTELIGRVQTEPEYAQPLSRMLCRVSGQPW